MLFVIAMLPLSSVLNESGAGYQLSKGEGKVNHLLFMDDLKLYGRNEKEINSLVHTVRVFSSDTGMDFGIEKCATMVTKRGKLDKSEVIRLPDGRIIRSIGDDAEGYKYLGVLEVDDIMHGEVKRSMKKEYIRRVKKTLCSKLNAGNAIRAINSWAVSLLWYSGGIVNWTKSELAELDRKTRKLLTIHGARYPRSNVSRLYLPRREGGRGLMSVEDAINIEERNINVYVCRSQERLLKAAWKRKNVDEIETPKEYKGRVKRKRTEDWSGKQLHGQFKRETEDLAGVSWNWIRTGELKKETEGLIFAAQDQAPRTNAVKARIENQNVSSKCRMFGSHDETVQHILCSCPKLAQTEYKKRHNN